MTVLLPTDNLIIYVTRADNSKENDIKFNKFVGLRE